MNISYGGKGTLDATSYGLVWNLLAQAGVLNEMRFNINTPSNGPQAPIITLENLSDGEIFFRYRRKNVSGVLIPFDWVSGVDISRGAGKDHYHFQIFRDTVLPIYLTIVEDGAVGLGMPDAEAHPSGRFEVRQVPGGLGSIFRVSAANGISLFEVGNDGWSDVLPWNGFAPIVSSQSGSLGAVSAQGRYKKMGKTVHASIKIDISDGGTAGMALRATLPAAKHPDFVGCWAARENGVSGQMWQAFMRQGEDFLTLKRYDDQLPSSLNGTNIVTQITYEAA